MNRPGYVLLAALALSVAISAAALAASAEVRLRRTAVKNATHVTVARKAAESALAESRARLADALRDPFATDPWLALHGSRHDLVSPTATARVLIIDLESEADTSLSPPRRVNLNTADEASLLAVPGMTASLVRATLRERATHGRIVSLFQVVNGMASGELGEVAADMPALERHLTVETRFVRVTSVGRAATSRIEVTGEAVFAREGNNSRLVRLQWH